MIRIPIEEITLGEMAAVEAASGLPFTTILTRGGATRKIAGIFIQELRTSGQAPPWSELGNLLPSDKRSSVLLSLDGASQTPKA